MWARLLCPYLPAQQRESAPGLARAGGASAAVHVCLQSPHERHVSIDGNRLRPTASAMSMKGITQAGCSCSASCSGAGGNTSGGGNMRHLCIHRRVVADDVRDVLDIHAARHRVRAHQHLCVGSSASCLNDRGKHRLPAASDAETGTGRHPSITGPRPVTTHAPVCILRIDAPNPCVLVVTCAEPLRKAARFAARSAGLTMLENSTQRSASTAVALRKTCNLRAATHLSFIATNGKHRPLLLWLRCCDAP